jgi:succinate dehydrogenase/fumarate reductase flavoprotein subunit
VPTTLASAPLDPSVIVTNLGILVLAVAAVISGVYTGWRKVKKMMRDEENPGPSGVFQTESLKVLKATITETTSMAMLSESNRNLAECVRHLDQSIGDLVDIMRDNKRAAEGQAEETHRLRVAVKDLHEQFRRSGIE